MGKGKGRVRKGEGVVRKGRVRKGEGVVGKGKGMGTEGRRCGGEGEGTEGRRCGGEGLEECNEQRFMRESDRSGKGREGLQSIIFQL